MVQEGAMDDTAEINNKLEQETSNLNLLKETLQRSSKLSQGMTSILTSFEDRLAKLEQTILPVYNETENLQQRQENIEKTLTALDDVISYYNVSKDVEHVIKDGPTSGLEVYLESIDKIQNSIRYFESSNPNSSELHTLTTLFDIAGDALEKEFRALLTRSSKAVPPVIILDLTMYDEELGPEEKLPIEHFPERTVNELVQIATWLVKNRREDYMNVYATIRSNILLKSLQGFKDHHKSSSGSSVTMLPVHSSPSMARRGKETPTRKTAKKIQQALMNKASKKILNFSQTVEQAAGLALGHRRQGSALEVKDEILDVEMDFYQSSVTAVHKLMQSELQLMDGIIPVNHQTQIFERVILQGLDMVVQEGESIATRAKKCVGKHDFLGALSVFPILKHLIGMKAEFDQLLENCQPSIRNKFLGVITTMQSTGSKALDDFIDSVKNDPDRQMPKDGTVHELTSNVMIFLEQLLDYVDTIGNILCEDPFYQPRDSATNKKRVVVGMYITRVLTMLGLTLNNKSEAYGDPFLKSIFRLNNIHYILKSLQRTGLSQVIQLYSRDVEDHYNDQILEQKRLYSQSWSRVLHYVMEVDKPLPVMSGSSKLKDKDRQNIKDKFTGFNKEIDDIFKMQKGYAIPDVELRESLKRDNKEYILPKYQAFYEKYHKMQFTKNPEKYIKHTPTQVSNLVDRFFDVAA